MNQTETQKTTIEAHPVYPFVRTGLAFDFHPNFKTMNLKDNVFNETDWWIEIDGHFGGVTYNSRESALEDVDHVLFSKINEGIVEKQIKFSVIGGNIELALLLSENKGKSIGYRDACAKMAEIDVQIEELLALRRKIQLFTPHAYKSDATHD